MAYKPGQCGNPKGRPKKGQTMTDMLNLYLSGKEAKSKKTRYEELIHTIYAMGRGGDTSALKYIFDRIDGKPKESIGLSSDSNEPLDITLTIHDAKTRDSNKPK